MIEVLRRVLRRGGCHRGVWMAETSPFAEYDPLCKHPHTASENGTQAKSHEKSARCSLRSGIGVGVKGVVGSDAIVAQ